MGFKKLKLVHLWPRAISFHRMVQTTYKLPSLETNISPILLFFAHMLQQMQRISWKKVWSLLLFNCGEFRLPKQSNRRNVMLKLWNTTHVSVYIVNLRTLDGIPNHNGKWTSNVHTSTHDGYPLASMIDSIKCIYLYECVCVSKLLSNSNIICVNRTILNGTFQQIDN